MGTQLFVLCTISLDTTFCTHACVILFFFFFFFWFFLSRVSAWTLSLQISSRTAVSLQLNVIVFFSVFLWKVMLVGQLLLRACLYQSSRFFGYFVQGGWGAQHSTYTLVPENTSKFLHFCTSNQSIQHSLLVYFFGFFCDAFYEKNKKYLF